LAALIDPLTSLLLALRARQESDRVRYRPVRA